MAGIADGGRPSGPGRAAAASCRVAPCHNSNEREKRDKHSSEGGSCVEEALGGRRVGWGCEWRRSS